MTTEEKIKKEIRKHNKGNKLSKLIGFIGMSIVFGFFLLLGQGMSYNGVANLSEDYVYTPDTTKPSYIQTMNEVSVDMSFWIYDQYSYLDSVSPTLGGVVLIGSSLLISMILVYLILVPMFGSPNRWYYDEFEITVNGKTNKIIKGLIIFGKVEDLGDKYKFNAGTYDLTGIRGTEEFEVEKWKVTDKPKKWKIW